MRRGRLRGLAAGLTAVVALVATTGAARAHEAPAVATPPPRYEAPPAGSYELPPIRSLAPHTLLDEQGHERALLELPPDSAAVVAFVYLDCPHACPRTHSAFQEIDRSAEADAALRGRVRLLTVSFDPARDPPERMAELRRGLRPKGDWEFRTAADPEELAPVLRDFGQDALTLVAPDGEDTGLIRHLMKVFLVDADRRVRNVYSSEFLRTDLVLNDVRTVLGISGP